jgi:hypothetical protein
MSAAVVPNIRIIALRDLQDVKKEVEGYPDDVSLWQRAPGTNNPAGTLALHLAGNMQHFIGVVLGNSSYVRNRDAEFSIRNLTREEVLTRLDEAISDVDSALSHLTDEDLQKPFPERLGGSHLLTGQFLIHCLAHLGYHLGQMDYHRRMITRINTNVTISAQSIPGLKGVPD